jgi:hypothetical protein
LTDAVIVQTVKKDLGSCEESTICDGEDKGADEGELVGMQTGVISTYWRAEDENGAHEGMLPEDKPVLPDESAQLQPEEAGHSWYGPDRRWWGC